MSAVTTATRHPAVYSDETLDAAARLLQTATRRSAAARAAEAA